MLVGLFSFVNLIQNFSFLHSAKIILKKINKLWFSECVTSLFDLILLLALVYVNFWILASCNILIFVFLSKKPITRMIINAVALKNHLISVQKKHWLWSKSTLRMQKC